MKVNFASLISILLILFEFLLIFTRILDLNLGLQFTFTLSLCLLVITVVVIKQSDADVEYKNNWSDSEEEVAQKTNDVDKPDDDGVGHLYFEEDQGQERLKRENRRLVHGRRRYNGKQHPWKPPRY